MGGEGLGGSRCAGSLWLQLQRRSSVRRPGVGGGGGAHAVGERTVVVEYFSVPDVLYLFVAGAGSQLQVKTRAVTQPDSTLWSMSRARRSLAAALSLAGARSVVASLWLVSDETTRDFMAAFHSALVTSGRAAALRVAQAALMSRPRTAHPYYWAPFVLIAAR